MKKMRYHDTLRSNIRQFMSISSCRTLDDLVASARERKTKLETEKNRKSDQFQSSDDSGKRPKVFDSRSRGQQGQGRCRKCGKTHDATCRVGGSGCFKYGKTGHYSRDCTATTTT